MRIIFRSLIVQSCLYVLLWSKVLLAHSHLVVPDIPAEIILDQTLRSDLGAGSLCDKACLDILSQLHDAVYVGQTGENFDFWDAKKREVIPACRVEPNNCQDVAMILRSLTSHQCHFVVKSGGHERGTPGSEMHENGVIIDLVRMKRLEVADDKESVTIGPGWRWLDLYQALEKQDIMVLGGRLGEVGVGGLLLGGGISFHSNWRGLACDAILSYEIVLPNATIMTVDQKTQPELYRALRGGAAMNFGIILSFTLEAFPQRSLWYGLKAFDWESVPELLAANYHVTTEAMNNDPHISVMNVFICNLERHICFGNILAQHAAHNSTSSWPTSFEAYEKIGALPHTFKAYVGPMSNLTSSFSGLGPVRHRTIYATFTYTPSVELEQLLVAIFREEAEHPSLENVTGWVPGIVMHPLSQTMLMQTRKRGGNLFSSISDRDGPLTVLNIVWQWNEKADDENVYASYYRIMARFEKAAKEMGLWHPFKYINYAEAAQNVFEHLSSFQMDRLRKLQKEIDPSGIFAAGGLARAPFKLDGGRVSQVKAQVDAAPDTEPHKDEL